MPLAAFPKCFLDAMCVEKTMSVEDWIGRAAAELDVDGLEFYWGFTPREDAEIARVRGLIEARGLTMPMMCYSPDFTQPDVAARAREVENEKRVIAVTAQLGGRLCRVLSGQRRPEVSIADGVKMAADCITALLPHAEKCGVTLILENHYKDGYWDFPEFAQKRDTHRWPALRRSGLQQGRQPQRNFRKQRQQSQQNQVGDDEWHHAAVDGAYRYVR